MFVPYFSAFKIHSHTPGGKILDSYDNCEPGLKAYFYGRNSGADCSKGEECYPMDSDF